MQQTSATAKRSRRARQSVGRWVGSVHRAIPVTDFALAGFPIARDALAAEAGWTGHCFEQLAWRLLDWLLRRSESRQHC